MKKKLSFAAVIGFTLSWILFAFLLPIGQIWGFMTNLILSSLISFITYRISEKVKSRRSRKQYEKMIQNLSANSSEDTYSPEVQSIMSESERALSEMARIYTSINDKDIRSKINELMLITDKITQDAATDPSDIPQIKKFFSYYLPTTIKLLNTYDRMGSQTIKGENIDKSMKSIDEMLDTTIDAYKKRLDSLFADQAVDVETEIDVMNTMLEREGLTEKKDF